MRFFLNQNLVAEPQQPTFTQQNVSKYFNFFFLENGEQSLHRFFFFF